MLISRQDFWSEQKITNEERKKLKIKENRANESPKLPALRFFTLYRGVVVLLVKGVERALSTFFCRVFCHYCVTSTWRSPFNLISLEEISNITLNRLWAWTMESKHFIPAKLTFYRLMVISTSLIWRNTIFNTTSLSN